MKKNINSDLHTCLQAVIPIFPYLNFEFENLPIYAFSKEYLSHRVSGFQLGLPVSIEWLVKCIYFYNYLVHLPTVKDSLMAVETQRGVMCHSTRPI